MSESVSGGISTVGCPVKVSLWTFPNLGYCANHWGETCYPMSMVSFGDRIG